MGDAGLDDDFGPLLPDQLLQPEQIGGELDHRPAEPAERVAVAVRPARPHPGLGQDRERLGRCDVVPLRSSGGFNADLVVVDSDTHHGAPERRSVHQAMSRWAPCSNPTRGAPGVTDRSRLTSAAMIGSASTPLTSTAPNLTRCRPPRRTAKCSTTLRRLRGSPLPRLTTPQRSLSSTATIACARSST